MTAPVPLTSPDGAVRAWACPRCGTPRKVARSAEVCCGDECRVPWCAARTRGPYAVCAYHHGNALQGLCALAAIGMAVAVSHLANSIAARDFDGSVWCEAMLCGVDFETARGWPR